MLAKVMMIESATVDVSAAAKGDRDAFARLVKRYQNAVSAVALAMTRSVAVSQDVSQAAFIEAWRALPTLRNPDSFGPWLLQLTRRQAQQQARGSRRATRRDTTFFAEQSGTAPSADELLVARQLEQQLLQALEEVPADSRELLLLYYREGRATEQVAELLGLSPAAVRKRLERARDILRERFDALEVTAQRTAPPLAFVALVMSSLESAATATAVTSAVVGIAKWVALGLALLAPVWWFHQPEQPPTTLAAQQVAPSQGRSMTLPWSPAPGPTLPSTSGWFDVDDGALDPYLGARARASVAGEVRRPDGTPAAKAIVLWSTTRGTLRTTTDASGHYALTVPEESYSVAAHLDDWAGTHPTVRAKAGGQWEHVDIDLQAGARIDGVVRFADGKPAPAATIRLSSHDRHGDWVLTTSDDSGTFTFKGLPPGAFDVVAQHATLAASADQIGVSLLMGGNFFSELRFAPATATRGVLTDDTGTPLAGWRIAGDDPASAESVITSTDGSFTSAKQWPVGPRTFFLFTPTGEAPAHRVTWRSGDLAAIVKATVADDQPLHLTVARPGTIDLHAMGNTLDGRPFATVNFHIILPIGGWVPAWSITKRLDERASLRTSLPAGEYFVTVAAGIDDGSESTGFPLKLKVGEFVQRELSTRAGPAVRIVVQEENGLIVADAELLDTLAGASRTADGALLMQRPDECPCPIRVRAGARIGTTTLQPGQLEAVIVMPASGRVHGRVVGVSGSFTVQLTSTQDSWHGGPDPRVFSGNEFELLDAPAGDARITVSANGHSASKELSIQPGATTETQLQLAAAATVKGRIAMREGTLPRPTPVVILDKRTPQQSGADGSFSFSDIAAGRHTIEVEMFNKVVATIPIDLAEGSDLMLDPVVLDPATLPLQPTLRDRTNEP